MTLATASFVPSTPPQHKKSERRPSVLDRWPHKSQSISDIAAVASPFQKTKSLNHSWASERNIKRDCDDDDNHKNGSGRLTSSLRSTRTSTKVIDLLNEPNREHSTNKRITTDSTLRGSNHRKENSADNGNRNNNSSYRQEEDEEDSPSLSVPWLKPVNSPARNETTSNKDFMAARSSSTPRRRRSVLDRWPPAAHLEAEFQSSSVPVPAPPFQDDRRSNRRASLGATRHPGILSQTPTYEMNKAPKTTPVSHSHSKSPVSSIWDKVKIETGPQRNKDIPTNATKTSPTSKAKVRDSVDGTRRKARDRSASPKPNTIPVRLVRRSISPGTARSRRPVQAPEDELARACSPKVQRKIAEIKQKENLSQTTESQRRASSLGPATTRRGSRRDSLGTSADNASTAKSTVGSITRSGSVKDIWNAAIASKTPSQEVDEPIHDIQTSNPASSTVPMAEENTQMSGESSAQTAPKEEAKSGQRRSSMHTSKEQHSSNDKSHAVKGENGNDKTNQQSAPGKKSKDPDSANNADAVTPSKTLENVSPSKGNSETGRANERESKSNEDKPKANSKKAKEQPATNDGSKSKIKAPTNGDSKTALRSNVENPPVDSAQVTSVKKGVAQRATNEKSAAKTSVAPKQTAKNASSSNLENTSGDASSAPSGQSKNDDSAAGTTAKAKTVTTIKSTNENAKKATTQYSLPKPKKRESKPQSSATPNSPHATGKPAAEKTSSTQPVRPKDNNSNPPSPKSAKVEKSSEHSSPKESEGATIVQSHQKDAVSPAGKQKATVPIEQSNQKSTASPVQKPKANVPLSNKEGGNFEPKNGVVKNNDPANGLQNDGKFLLVLISTQSLSRDQLAIQQKAQTVMKSLHIPFEELDGSIQANREKRNELFYLSGIRGKYPQFFVIQKHSNQNSLISFFGDWEAVDLLNENGVFLKSFRDASPSFLLSSVLSSETPETTPAESKPAPRRLSMSKQPASPSKNKARSSTESNNNSAAGEPIERQDDKKHLLVLLSSQSLSRDQLAIQQKVQTILKVLKIPYQEVDGSLKSNLSQRNELFDISGIRGKYPQFFVVSCGSTSFFGDWDTFDILNENGELPKAFDAAPATLPSSTAQGQIHPPPCIEENVSPSKNLPKPLKSTPAPTNNSSGGVQESRKQGADEKYVLVLISKQSLSREQLAIQQKVQTILKLLKIPYQELDGSIKDNHDRRNELFELSGIRAKYPQFFIVSRNGTTNESTTTFWGDWDTFDMLNENAELVDSFRSMPGSAAGSPAAAPVKTSQAADTSAPATEKPKTAPKSPTSSIKKNTGQSTQPKPIPLTSESPQLTQVKQANFSVQASDKSPSKNKFSGGTTAISQTALKPVGSKNDGGSSSGPKKSENARGLLPRPALKSVSSQKQVSSTPSNNNNNADSNHGILPRPALRKVASHKDRSSQSKSTINGGSSNGNGLLPRPTLKPTQTNQNSNNYQEAGFVENEELKHEPKYVLVLMSSQSLSREQLAIQQKIQAVFKFFHIPFQQFDGAIPANRERRNQLFELSGIRANYPQFFVVHNKNNNNQNDEEGKSKETSFWGDWETVDLLNENGSLKESFLATSPT